MKVGGFDRLLHSAPVVQPRPPWRPVATDCSCLLRQAQFDPLQPLGLAPAILSVDYKAALNASYRTHPSALCAPPTRVPCELNTALVPFQEPAFIAPEVLNEPCPQTLRDLWAVDRGAFCQGVASCVHWRRNDQERR